MPTSSKLVVLDTRLEVKKAFHALIENSLRSAPLWDNEVQDYVGLLTVSDFVSILLAYHKLVVFSLKIPFYNLGDHSFVMFVFSPCINNYNNETNKTT